MNQLRFIRETIYALKREYGVAVDIYTVISETVDRATGIRNQEKKVFRIKRGILLPRQVVPTNVPLIASGGRAVHHGAHPSKANRVIIIDARDFPSDYVPKQEDYITVGIARFNICEIQDFQHRAAVVLRVEEIEGELPRRILEVPVKTKLDLNSGSLGEP